VHVPPVLAVRAARHAALGDPLRLSIVETLRCCDRSPIELRQLLDLGSNLLAHHLDVLEGVGIIERFRSGGDGRRRYVHLRPEALDELFAAPAAATTTPVFICTANSARSQLAEALWRSITGGDCCSAGTHPADAVHEGAILAAERAGLDLSGAEPRLISALDTLPDLVITVCDRAHEELEPKPTWLHWSIPDPTDEASNTSFDAVVAQLTERIETLQSAINPVEALR